MSVKTISKKDFDDAKEKYEDAVQSRAETIKAMRDKLGWKFGAIAKHFGISRQAAQKIYASSVEKE